MLWGLQYSILYYACIYRMDHGRNYIKMQDAHIIGSYAISAFDDDAFPVISITWMSLLFIIGRHTLLTKRQVECVTYTKTFGNSFEQRPPWPRRPYSTTNKVNAILLCLGTLQERSRRDRMRQPTSAFIYFPPPIRSSHTGRTMYVCLYIFIYFY